MAQIVWNKRASRQFEELQRYLQEEFGEKTAETFTSGIFRILELLLQYFYIGNIEEAGKRYKRLPATPEYTILYKY